MPNIMASTNKNQYKEFDNQNAQNKDGGCNSRSNSKEIAQSLEKPETMAV
jgi:hypothetical protein